MVRRVARGLLAGRGSRGGVARARGGGGRRRHQRAQARQLLGQRELRPRQEPAPHLDIGGVRPPRVTLVTVQSLIKLS